MTDPTSLNRIARDQAKHLTGQVAWPTILLGLVVFSAYWVIPYLVAFVNFSLWFAIPIMVVLTYAAYTVLHESVHGSIRGKNKSLQWLNDGLGYLSGTILLTPLTVHRPEHLSHHANTNHGDRDPDQYSAGIVGSPREIFRSVWDGVATQYRFYMSTHWQKAPTSRNAMLILEIFLGIGLRVLPFVVLFSTNNPELTSGWWRLVVLFLVSGFLGVYVLVYLFAYIVHRPHTETGRYRDTSTIVIKGPLSKVVTLFWGYQNYHSIHHLFPSVPFFHYRRLFDDISGIMDEMGAPIYQLTWAGLRKIRAADL